MTGRPGDKPEYTEEKIDETVEESFPASDPPAHSGITGNEPPPTCDPTPGEAEKDKPAKRQSGS